MSTPPASFLGSVIIDLAAIDWIKVGSIATVIGVILTGVGIVVNLRRRARQKERQPSAHQVTQTTGESTVGQSVNAPVNVVGGSAPVTVNVDARQSSSPVPPVAQPKKPSAEEISDHVHRLLSKIQSKSVPLSQCIAEALAIAQSKNSPDFSQFCRNELTGWNEEEFSKLNPEQYKYRVIQWVGFLGEVQFYTGLWGQTGQEIMVNLRRHPDRLHPAPIFNPESVSKIESKKPAEGTTGIFTSETTTLRMLPDSKGPDAPIFLYSGPETYRDLLESIRSELSRRLLSLLSDEPRNAAKIT